ncbi:MAG: hypothetical protein AAB588_05550, partial [Patescibacteria group bacterium]
ILAAALVVFYATHSIIVEGDSQTYHLPFVIEWLQNGHIFNVLYTPYVGPLGYYPGNYELLLFWLMAPVRHDFFVPLLNIIIFIPWLFCLGGLASFFTENRNKVMMFLAAFVFSPLFIRQLGVPQNDLFFAFALSATIFFFLHFLRHGARHDLYFAAMAWGLFVGTKMSGIPYGGVLFLAALIILITQKHFHRERRCLSNLLWALGIAFLFSAFWYVRNWSLTGNPLFPIDVSLFGQKIFDGYRGITEHLRSLSLMAYLKTDQLLTVLRFIKSFGVSVGFHGIFIGIAAVTSFVSLFKRNAKNRSLKLLFLFLMLIFFGLYVVAPFTGMHLYPNIRYLVPFLLFGFLLMLFSPGLSRTVSGIFYALCFANIVLLIPSQGRLIHYMNDYVFYDLAFTFQLLPWFLLFLAALLAFGLGFFKRRKISFVAAIFILIPFLWHAFQFRELKQYEAIYMPEAPPEKILLEPRFKNLFSWISDHLPMDANIAVSRVPLLYHLYGKQFTRRVSYININNCDGCLYHDFMYSPQSILRDPNYKDWLKNLAGEGKQYLVLGPHMLPELPRYEYVWAREHPESFTLLYEKEDIFVYQIHG